MALAILASAIIFTFISYYGLCARPQKSDAIIILGCYVSDGEPSLALEYRLEEGLRLYRAGYADNIIVTGGQGANETEAESKVMKDWLVSNGVNPQNVIAEDKSLNTYENFKFSKAFIEQRGFRSVTIATSNYHEFRSIMIARRLGISCSGAPSKDVWYLEPFHVIREIIAVIKNMLLGRM